MPFEKILIDDFTRPARRQPQRPPEPSAADLAEHEQSRQSRREAAKRRIAAAKLAELRWREICAAIDAINARKDDLASEHVARCQPLQAELAEIEQQQINHLKAGEPLDPEADMRRRELLAELQNHNADLEDAIAREDRLLSQLEVDRVAAAKAANVGIHESDLIDLGRRDLVLTMRVCQRACEWAERRMRAVADDKRSPADLHAAELAAASAALAEAKRELAEATRDVLDE